MIAVGLDYTQRRLTRRELPEPEPRDDEVLLEVAEVGICGTDRELARFHFGFPPEGDDFLTLGHEAVARVAAAGSAVRDLRPGDWVAPMIRRTCAAACPHCLRGRRDLCSSGGWRDRGVLGLHGYFTRYAVDLPADLIRIPDHLAARAVLMEPLSVVEKAVEKALRLHEPGARSVLVMGAGPIGILAGLVFQLRGLDVTLASLEDASSPRVKLIRKAGLVYRQGLTNLDRADIVVEATGSPAAAVAGFRFLNPLGVYALIGGRDASGDFPLRDMVLFNQAVFGAVNASPQAFHAALEDLERFDGAVAGGLFHRVSFDAYETTILGPPGETIKYVHRIRD